MNLTVLILGFTGGRVILAIITLDIKMFQTTYCNITMQTLYKP